MPGYTGICVQILISISMGQLRKKSNPCRRKIFRNGWMIHKNRRSIEMKEL